MRAGDLRHRVTIQRRTLAVNSFGEPIETWSAVATVWAAVEPLSGNKYFSAKQANVDITGTVRIRHRDDIEPTMRLLFGGRYLRIVSIVTPKETPREIQIMYREQLD